MKKHILFSVLIVAFVLSLAKAQPTITSANMYAIGDVLTMQSVDASGISEGPAGANQTWDFTGLVNSGTVTTQSVVTPSGTPYASSFPNATIALDVGGGAFGYFDASGADLLNLGIGTSSVIIAYSDAQKFVTYPFTFNTTFSDNLAATYDLAGNPTTRTGTVSFLADGYGTLMLPTGTISNVLRVKYTQDITDITDIGPIEFTTNTKTTTYFWMIPGNKNALLDISFLEVTVAGNTTNSQSAFYFPGSVGIQDLLHETTLQLFPNPARDKVMLSADLSTGGNLHISIADASGRIVREESANVASGVYSGDIDVSDMANGIYFLTGKMENSIIFTSQLIKQ